MYIITARILNYCPVSSLVQYLFEIIFMLKCLLREGEGKKKISFSKSITEKVTFLPGYLYPQTTYSYNGTQLKEL